MNTRPAIRRRRSWRPNLEQVEERQLLSAISVEYANTAHETDAYGGIVQKDLGAPTSAEVSVPGVPGALEETFQGGAIYWSQNTGAHVVYGGIGAKYAALAYETDAYGRDAQLVLGLPKTDEVNVAGMPGARMNTFQNGAIYWSQATSAHAVYGGIAAEYAATANETDYYGNNVQKILGLPMTDEMNVAGVPGARMNTFQGGAIYWSQNTGAHAVYGGIGALYNSMGGPTSYLGLPTSGEQGIPGGRETFFQNGKILWTPQGGAYAVRAVSQMTFNTGFFNLQHHWYDAPVSGWASLTVYADGSYHFTGHLHDGGPFSYNDSLVIGLVSPSGVLYTITHTGHVSWSPGGSNNDDWNVSGTIPGLAAGWKDLEGCRFFWEAKASWDWKSFINEIEEAVGVIVEVVSVVV
jgi:hypothetical protein